MEGYLIVIIPVLKTGNYAYFFNFYFSLAFQGFAIAFLIKLCVKVITNS